jgi:hypothetical protein
VPQGILLVRQNSDPLMRDPNLPNLSAGMGVAVLLANQTLQNITYAQAAAEELEFLLCDVPRAWNGAISHRVSEAQLVGQISSR